MLQNNKMKILNQTFKTMKKNRWTALRAKQPNVVQQNRNKSEKKSIYWLMFAGEGLTLGLRYDCSVLKNKL